jgi:hypothetical protein
MLAANHEASTFALTCTCAALAGVPPLGCIALAVVGAFFGDLPDIDMPRSRVTQALCLVRYPVWHLDEHHLPKRHEKGRRQGKIRWTWRSFPGHQLHRLCFRASCAVFDLCATDADREDLVPMFGAKFRGHRGLTHSLWFALAVGAGLWLVLPTVGDLIAAVWPVGARADWSPIFGPDSLRVLLPTVAVVGTFGHTLGNCCTDYGCAPLAPLLRWDGRRYAEMGLPEPLRFKVNKWVESVIIAPICLALAAASVLGALGVLPALLRGIGRFWAALAAS